MKLTIEVEVADDTNIRWTVELIQAIRDQAGVRTASLVAIDGKLLKRIEPEEPIDVPLTAGGPSQVGSQS